MQWHDEEDEFAKSVGGDDSMPDTERHAYRRAAIVCLVMIVVGIAIMVGLSR